MDRRDALKKLGVGGAVAVAGPVLLDSFNVASASSFTFPDANISATELTPSKTVRLSIVNAASFPSGTTFSWTQSPSFPPAYTFTPGTNQLDVDNPASNANDSTGAFTVFLRATLTGNNPGFRDYNVAYAPPLTVTVT